MNVRLIFQPFEDDLALYEVLGEALADTRLMEFTVVVAWAKESGLRRIRPAVAAFRARGGTANILLGVDEGGATVEGLRAAIADFDEATVLFDSASGTFHPKLYLAAGETASIVIIGSNNLTPGGLFANYEAGTCLELDLAEAADAQLQAAVSDYVRRLHTDGTSRRLNDDSVQELLDDPRFKIGSEAEPRNRGDDDEDDSLGAWRRHIADPSLFGKSQHRKKADPAPRLGKKDASSRPSEDVGGSAAAAGGSTAPAVARWSKQLTRSDSGQPRAGSQTTAALRFTKAGEPIDQTRWFRERLFGEEAWQPDLNRAGRENAGARFDVIISGISRGTHELQLKHDAARQAGQHNFTTDLKWGSLNPVLRSEDLTDKWVTIEKLADGSLRLTVAEAPTGAFMS